jgi:hypothetical protein
MIGNEREKGREKQLGKRKTRRDTLNVNDARERWDRKMATNFRKVMIFNSRFEEEEEYNIDSLIRNSKKGTNGSCFFLKNKQKKNWFLS